MREKRPHKLLSVSLTVCGTVEVSAAMLFLWAFCLGCGSLGTFALLFGGSVSHCDPSELEKRRMIAVSIFGVLAVLATLTSALKNDYPAAAPTYEARDFTKWDSLRAGKSRRATVDVRFAGADGAEDYVTVTRLDLVGNSYDRGYAFGKLMSKGRLTPSPLWINSPRPLRRK